MAGMNKIAGISIDPFAWRPITATCTPVSVNDPIGIFNINDNMSLILFPGACINFVNDGNSINGYIVSVGAYSGGVTPITFFHEIETTNNANALHLMNITKTISEMKYNYLKPAGFPRSPLSWTLITMIDTIQAVTSPSTTYKQAGTATRIVPTGLYNIKAKLVVQGSFPNVTGAGIWVSLTDSIPNSNYPRLEAFSGYDDGATNTKQLLTTVTLEDTIPFSTTKSLMVQMKGQNVNPTVLQLSNAVKSYIKAECAYLYL